MRRPQSLVEVSRIAVHARDRFWTALDEFLDTFYLEHGDPIAQYDRIDDAPLLLGDPLLDAWTGAVGEHLGERWLLNVPEWTDRDAHFRLARPQFVPPTPSLRGFLIASSPPAFRSRGIYTVSEPLQRARFPRDIARPYVVQRPTPVRSAA